MSRNDPFVRLHHMLDYAQEAVSMARDKTAAELSENRQLALALTHLVELIGEAASQVPHRVQAQYPQIPWPKVIATRHRLIHGYDFVPSTDRILLFLPLISPSKAVNLLSEHGTA